MRSGIFVALVLTGCLLICGCGAVDKAENLSGEPNMETGRQQAKSFEKFDIKMQFPVLNAKYYLYLPADYEKDQTAWPLILFLHGAGERGDDLAKIKVHGLPKILQEKKDFPFVVVSPQCPADNWWSSDMQLLLLNELLDEIISKYQIDTNRVYLTGLSMGGYGTWALAIKEPERFAAIVPICGVGQVDKACRLKNTPVWAFHGAKDPTVPVEKTKQMVEAVRKCGGDAEMTIYPDAEHDSWTRTYANPRVFQWLLEHSR